MDDPGDGDILSNMNDTQTISAFTWDKMKESMCRAGYREGASAGWDSAFQSGFDCGYAQGYSDGFSLGVLKGILSMGGQEVGCDESTGSLPEKILKKYSAGMCQRCGDSRLTCQDFSMLTRSQEVFSRTVMSGLEEKYSGVLQEHDVVFP